MIPVGIRKAVWTRADFRCEYCRLHQTASVRVLFHTEHVVARKHRGGDDLMNLALACHHCNLHKGSDLTSIDPYTGKLAILFNPRTELWSDHFRLSRVRVTGQTPTGRATVQLLQMNTPRRIALRRLATSKPCA